MSEDLSRTIFEDHSERLSRVETSMQDVSREVGTSSTKIDHIFSQQASLVDDVKVLGMNLVEKLDSMASKLDQSHSALDKRLSPLEEAAKIRHDRWKLAKKAIIPVLAAIMGVVGTRFGEEILAWVTR